jgi:hypothetical protein
MIIYMEAEGIVNECWRSVSGHINYQISNIGRVRNATTGRILKPDTSGRGYFTIRLSMGGTSTKFVIHRLVAQEFIENPAEKPYVDHIDGVRTNNCVSNLRWVSQSENNMNSRKTNSRKSSIYKGVAWDSHHARWRVQIMKDKTSYFAGHYHNEKDAARAYNAKAVELFGEYAYLNDISDDEDEAELPPSYPA